MTLAPPSPQSAPERPLPAAHGGHFAYLPGLDGLRAISVIAVILYHGDVTWFGGGFLGVEVFFVISGYLITSLLLAEQHRSGTVSVRNFWARRAKRLLPALFALLAMTILAAATIAPDYWSRLKGDVLAALGYYSNWWQIFHQDSYFVAAGRPPLLQHLWSLAVEEQFYVIWPLVFAFGASRLRRPWLAGVALVAGLASAVWMAVLHDPLADASRAYLGTDTRLSGLLIGVALAAIWPAHGFRKDRAARGAGPALDVFGLLGLIVLGWAFVRVNQFDSFIYRGGFVLIDVATVAVIAVIVHPSARLGRVLGLGALAWIGRRSYGLYLWHWPVFALTRPDLDVPIHGTALLLLRLTLTVALTELSFRLIEMPVRNGAIGRLAAQVRRPLVPSERVAGLRVLGVSALVVAVSATVLVAGPLRHVEDEAEMLATSTAMEIDDSATTTPPSTTTSVPSTTALDPALASAPTAPPTTAAPPTTTAPLGAIPGGVTALGDSVMIGAVDEMRWTLPGLNVNAEVSRQFADATAVLVVLRDLGQLQGNLVVHLGTNGWFTPTQFDQMMSIAGDRRVLFLTAKAARSWEGLTNQRLREGVERHPNAKLADWHAYGSAHPEFFLQDGIHLNQDGQRAYAWFVREQLG